MLYGLDFIDSEISVFSLILLNRFFLGSPPNYLIELTEDTDFMLLFENFLELYSSSKI
jgi:hypothetical protein